VPRARIGSEVQAVRARNYAIGGSSGLRWDHERKAMRMLFILGCVGVVFFGALLLGWTLAWLAWDNAMFENYSWLEWITFGSFLESEISFRVYGAIAGALLLLGWWIGHVTHMW
jgi:hypothetical protein